ncbi:non-homologous end-joining DNA ligase [Pseudomonas sp. KSR10]|uniref:non-homologous end-joining DNA ligase n=1 Tax=Pseudomonas sp. KSR10 TaxID=2916654 RepID=UPI001EF76753|nr:non-homologous end-joining DNA ligase [Pseudomonas sp. KSR10]MCG6538494.1 non-homologous end-joining DNA ligase [Pseudomonas sp. KSR10]
MSAASGKSGRPDVGGIGISNPQRVIDARSGGTKLQLAEYYLAVGDWLTPHLRNRPLSIVRAPDGVDGENFFQRHCGRLKMPHMRVLDKSLDPEHARLIQADNITAVVEAVQMGTVEFHTWNARSDRIDRPDRIVFDLDPDPALPWSSMIEATSMTLELLAGLGLKAFLKTSGGRGMHVVVPIDRRQGWDCINEFARGVTARLATQAPEKIVEKMGPKNRVGKIFVDYLRNQRGASTVAAYSARARPGLPVSVPIRRDELEQIAGADQWTIHNLHERLEQMREDPWSDYASTRQGISARLLKALDA